MQSHAERRGEGGEFDDGATCFPGFFWRHLVASEVGLIPLLYIDGWKTTFLLGCSSAMLVLGRIVEKKPHPLQQSQVCNFCA